MIHNGVLKMTLKGWVVSCLESNSSKSSSAYTTTYALHPYDCTTILYDKYPMDWDGKKVEFEIVNTSWDGYQGGTYAKLINHVPDVKKMVDVLKQNDENGKPLTYWGGKQNDVREYDAEKGTYINGDIVTKDSVVREVVEDDVKDWAYLTSVSKGLDGSVYQSTYEDGFIDGYAKAKETMFTKEEALMIWKAGQEYWETSGASITFEELTEKLKKINNE